MSSDPRFSRLRSDPRFRRPKKTKSKIVVDERFKSVFAQEKKSKNQPAGRVDKYGRFLSNSHEQDNLRRFYRINDEAENVDEPKPIDFARGQVLLESSDEEDGDDAKDDDSGDTSDVDGFVTVGGNGEDSEAEIDLDESQTAELAAQAANYSKEHPEMEQGDRTSRIAVVNLDWDHVRASHLYKICTSLVSPTASTLTSSSRATTSSTRTVATSQIRGRVLSVYVYPSEFGKERMAREEKEGPPAEVFTKHSDSKEINEKTIYEVGDQDEVNEDALRKYQLERLRYYYAVIECDSVDAASHIYDELHGTELERSANLFDLSFVPDEMTFDNPARDEATEGSANQTKSLDFVTDALRHSKVKLTWDEDDPERAQVTRRQFSRKDIEEDNFDTYLASASSGSEQEDVPKRDSRKSQSRNKLRALLLGGNDDLPEGWAQNSDGDAGSDVDMEITFTPGLSNTQDGADETTIDKYKRKMKEKKKQRIDDRKKAPVKDDFFEEEEQEKPKEKPNKGREGKGRAPVDDMAHLVGEKGKHFNLKAIINAEKKSKWKSKKNKHASADETQPDFAIDVADSRFSVLHDDASFAIDPSNPQFKRTKGMSALLEEGGKRRQKRRGDGDGDGVASSSHKNEPPRKLESLVESVKRKSIAQAHKGHGKRQKL